MDRRPLERIVRWQPDCTATQQNDSAGFEGPQRSDNGCGLRTRSNPLANTHRAPHTAPILRAETLDRAGARTAKTDPLAKPRHAGRPDAQRSPNTDTQRNHLEEPMHNETRPGMSRAQTTRLPRAYNPEKPLTPNA